MKDRINYYIFFPAVFLLFFLQTTFLAQLFWGSFPPNLVLMLILAAVFLSESADFIYLAFLFGFLFDVFAAENFGIFIASFVLSSIMTFYMKEKFLKESSPMKIAGFSVMGILIYNFIYLFLLTVVFNGNIFLSYEFLSQKIFWDIAYSIVLIYPATLLIYRKTNE